MRLLNKFSAIAEMNPGPVKNFGNYAEILVLLLLFAGFTACGVNDGEEKVDIKTYTLSERNASGVSGTATFERVDGNKTRITLDMTGTPDTTMHPAHIHENAASEGGAIVISLNNVDGATGTSVTTVSSTDINSPINFDQLLQYDGYINVHRSQEDFTVISQGNIGSNADGTGGNTDGGGGDGGGYDY